MAQKRHVFPISLDDDLIADIKYAYNTSGDKTKMSRQIEEILRGVIPARPKA